MKGKAEMEEDLKNRKIQQYRGRDGNITLERYKPGNIT